jgi:alginate O-acetyltransferase complex protein AlgI
MLFNSLEFLLLFLPIVLSISLLLRGSRLTFWIALASCIFYAFAGHVWFLIPMFVSATLDFWAGNKIHSSTSRSSKKFYLWLSVFCSFGLLAYFKYSGMILDSIHILLIQLGLSQHHDVLLPAFRVILPAGISFYTFQTISYVIDIYRGDGHPEKKYLTYFSFVSFFPHLVAGPLTRHNQLIPQIRNIAENGFKPLWRAGLFLFITGLAKKVLIADRIAYWIDPLIQNIGDSGAFEAWVALLGYSFQIYFDFSGYSDMAIGLGRLFQIELPMNFNSPYKAISPSDFWRRWHITLSQWLRDYLYISLGGNQCSPGRQKFNLMITMLLGGLWHGASWTFLCWGAYHGLLLFIYHQYKVIWDRQTKFRQTALTFFFITLGWVFFRSLTFEVASLWFRSLFFMNGLYSSHTWVPPYLLILIILGAFMCTKFKNSMEIEWENLTIPRCVILGTVGALCILLMNYSSKFLYFQF